MTIDSHSAKTIDKYLLSPEAIGYEIEQLIELAGFFVSRCIDDYIADQSAKVLVLCGSGNNGNDGLVTARHLAILNYSVSYYMPKRGSKEFTVTLLHQANAVGVTKVEDIYECLDKFDYFVDAITGFGFVGNELSGPWPEILKTIKKNKYPIIALDVPSGYPVDQVLPTEVINESCEVLISLIAPKRCVENYTKIHYLTGRFIKPAMLAAKGFPNPEYPLYSEFIRLDENI